MIQRLLRTCSATLFEGRHQSDFGRRSRGRRGLQRPSALPPPVVTELGLHHRGYGEASLADGSVVEFDV